jgi:hypothetical protein
MSTQIAVKCAVSGPSAQPIKISQLFKIKISHLLEKSTSLFLVNFSNL